nr:guanine nucleotide-binding protein-like nsn1 [Quercus suber]
MSFLRRRLPLPLPLGARFEPSDAVLISSYLSPKIRKEVLAWDVIGFSDEVYDKPPWEFCTDSTAVLDDEKHYFFTLLKRGKNRVLRSVGSYGTWHESSTKKIYDSGSGSGKTIIGFNKLLNFRVKGEGKEMMNTDWLMHEFSVAEKGSDLVLCVIYKKIKKKEERSLALALERPPSVVVDSGILGSPKSVFDQVDFFDRIDDTDIGGQDPYDDQDPVFYSGILGSPKSVFDQLDFFDDTGMGGQDPYDDQDPFDESPRFAAIDGHSQFQVLDSREDGLTKNMGSEVEGFDGFDEAEVEALLLDLADDTDPDFDPLSFLDLQDLEEGAQPSKKMRCDFSDRAQKRKLGLPEDDDSSKLATSASPGELNVKDISTGVGKNRGKIPYNTMPLIRNQGEPTEAKIVSELGKEFNIDEVYDTESSFLGSLKFVDDLNPVEVPLSCPLNFDEDLLEVCDLS